MLASGTVPVTLGPVNGFRMVPDEGVSTVLVDGESTGSIDGVKTFPLKGVTTALLDGVRTLAVDGEVSVVGVEVVRADSAAGLVVPTPVPTDPVGIAVELSLGIASGIENVVTWATSIGSEIR